MTYITGSVERRLLDNDPQALGEVNRWIAVALTSPRFWALRSEWPDLHQEVFARIVESLRKQRYDPSRDFHTYVLGIARHTAQQALSRRLRTVGLSGQDLADAGTPDPEGRAASRQLARRVLELASEECRSLIRAYFCEDRTYAEIADSLDVPIGTVKSRLFRCLEAAHLSLRGFVRHRNRRRSAGNKARAEDTD